MMLRVRPRLDINGLEHDHRPASAHDPEKRIVRRRLKDDLESEPVAIKR